MTFYFKIGLPLKVIPKFLYFKICGRYHIFYNMWSPLKVRGTTFFGCINVRENSGPHRYYKVGPYVLKYVVLPLKLRGTTLFYGCINVR